MGISTQTLYRRLRVIWAITAKDLLDAIKNKTTLGVILPAVFMLVFYRFIPQIYGHDDQIAVFIYEPTPSGAVLRLEDSLDLKIREVDSEAAVIKAISDGDVAELGLVLPEGLSLDSSAPLLLQGYMLYWIPESDRIETIRTVEDELGYLLERPVEISSNVKRVYYQVDSDGLGFLASMSINFVLVMIGISFLPNLMLEEHKEETMQVLQVSPASNTDILIAKGLTGMFYSLAMSLAAWVLYRNLIIHAGLTAGVFVIGSLLFISIGLLLGTLVKTRQQLMMIGWIIILPLLLPPFMEIMDDILPGTLLRWIRWVPSVAIARMMRAGFALKPDLSFYLQQMLYLLIISVLFLGLNIVLFKRRDR